MVQKIVTVRDKVTKVFEKVDLKKTSKRCDKNFVIKTLIKK